MRKILAAFVLLASLSTAADELSESRALQAAAMEAKKQNDAATFLSKIAAASALRPQHSGLLYQLAIAQAMNGRHAEATVTLQRVAGMGFVYPAAKESAFAALAELPQIIAAFARNAQPVGRPAGAMAFDRLGQLNEGVAFDPSTGRLFLGSVRTRRIFDADGRVFASGLPYGVFGMTVDAKRRVLWAATSALPQMEGFTAADEGKAALAKVDLLTGRVVATYSPADAVRHLFGDVALAPNGDIYTTNTLSPIIYRLEGDRLQPYVKGPFASLQGLAVAPNGKRVYVADYAQGLFAIDLATRDVVRLRVPEAISLLGIDGLYAARADTLVGTQNGTNPARVLRINLQGLRVTSVDVLAANDPRMTDLTLGALGPDDFYFVANAQWDAWDENGAAKPDFKLEPVHVLRVTTRRSATP